MLSTDLRKGISVKSEESAPSETPVWARWRDIVLNSRAWIVVDWPQPRPVIRFLNRHSWLVLAAVLLAVFIFEVVDVGVEWRKWDHMFVSGYVAIVVGIFLSLGIRRRLREAVQRLARRGVMSMPDDPEGDAFVERFEQRVLVWSHRIALVIGALILAMFLSAYWQEMSGIRISETALGTFAAYCAGRIIGRMIVYGFLGWTIRNEKIALTAVPGHVDGAGGFKPLGDFYFFQAMLLTIPVLFVGLWLLLIPA